MIPIGTLVNIFAVLFGSLLGLYLKKIIDIDMNKKIFLVMGLFTIILGLSMTIETVDFIFMLVSIVIGTFLGEYYNIEGEIVKYINLLKQKFGINDANFTDGLVTAFLLYCIGSMTIVGAIDEGLGNPPSILYTKSIMDGISSIVLASTFGVGVIFSIFPMLIFQGGITLLVFIYKDIFPQELIHHINSVGGVLIVAIGFKILGYKKINPTNMLPSLVVIFVLYIIKTSLF